MKLDWKFYIPTDEMKIIDMYSGEHKHQGDCVRLTKFFEDAGQLHWKHGRGVQTINGYFVQAWDQEMVFVVEDRALNIGSVAQYLDANIRCEVIKCRVPLDEAYKYEQAQYGALLFLSEFHPSHQMRVDALEEMAERYFPRMTAEERLYAMNQRVS